MNQKEILINGELVIVAKLPLKKYAELLGAFEELPKHLDLVSNKSQAEVLTNLPQLLSVCYPDVVRILTIATTLTAEKVDAMGLDDLASVVEAILEVNNYAEIYNKIKKINAPQPQALSETQPS